MEKYIITAYCSYINIKHIQCFERDKICGFWVLKACLSFGKVIIGYALIEDEIVNYMVELMKELKSENQEIVIGCNFLTHEDIEKAVEEIKINP